MSHFLMTLNAFAASWSVAFVRASWQGGLVIALLWLLCRLWPTLPPVPRCWLWRAAYAKLLLGLICLPPLLLPVLPATPIVAQSARAPRPSPASGRGESEKIGPVGAPLAAPPALTALSFPTPVFSPLPLAGEGADRVPPALPSVPTCLLAAWLLGLFIGLIRIVRAWQRASRLHRTSKLLGNVALLTEMAGLCRRFGLRRVPPLRVTEELSSPILLGLRRPAILLPAFALADCPPAELRLMLAHEASHLKRRDLVWSALPALARLLFFFHPLMWLAEHEWMLAQEIACDAQAVQITQTPLSAYGRMLLHVAARRPVLEASLFPTLAVAAPRRTLHRRLFAMQHFGTASRPQIIVSAALLTALVLGGLLPWRVVAQSKPALPISHAASQGDETWQKNYQKELADIASSNAQIDAELTEIRKQASPAKEKQVQAFLIRTNAEYAKNQQHVQILEQQRAAYLATHPNRLSDAQIADVQRLNYLYLHRRFIEPRRNAEQIIARQKAKVATLPEDQQKRVAKLRRYDLEIACGRMSAFIEKKVALAVFKERVLGEPPVRRQSRSIAALASIITPLLGRVVAQSSREDTKTTQPTYSAPVQVSITPVLTEAFDEEIARRKSHLQILEQQRTRYLAAHPGRLSDNEQANLSELQYLEIQRNGITAGAAWGEVVKAKLKAHLAEAHDARSRKSFQAQIAAIDADQRAGQAQIPALDARLSRQKAKTAPISEDRRQETVKKSQFNTAITVESATIGFLKARRTGEAWAYASPASANSLGLNFPSLRRFEQKAQQDRSAADHYVFLLATQEELRLIAPIQDQWFRQMKRRNASRS